MEKNKVRYKMFKNHLHNDLKIDKDEIREIIRETVKKEIEHLINTTSIREVVHDEIRDKLHGNDWYSTNILKGIEKSVTKILLGKLDFDIKVKEDKF